MITHSSEFVRAGAIFALQDEKTTKLNKAEGGDIVAIAKTDNVRSGIALGRKAIGDMSARQF